MKCTFCNFNKTRVLDKRLKKKDNSIRRRRECKKCGKRFTTYENAKETNILVIKNNGSLQKYDRNKIKRGIILAVEKRSISSEDIEAMMDIIERKINNLQKEKISSKKIGNYVINLLKKKDKVAYMRFASVYKKFDNVKSFQEEAKKII